MAALAESERGGGRTVRVQSVRAAPSSRTHDLKRSPKQRPRARVIRSIAATPFSIAPSYDAATESMAPGCLQ